MGSRSGGKDAGRVGVRSDVEDPLVRADPDSRHKDHEPFVTTTFHQQIFDLYIPDTIYHKAATRDFIEELRQLAEGATI